LRALVQGGGGSTAAAATPDDTHGVGTTIGP
jgi:hypothetical protein